MSTWSRFLLLSLAGCAPAAPAPGQPSVQAWLVVHVDPLPRAGGDPCATSGLGTCGRLYAPSWVERTENLAWLAERWLAEGRTLDLQLGPEAALGWSEDPEVAASLALSLAEQGMADPEARVAEVAASGRASVAALVSGGAASLGVHVHEVLPEEGGLWGAVDVARAEIGDEGLPEACLAWEDEPLPEVDAALVERVVAYGATGAAALAAEIGAPLESFTGHLPRAMVGKIAVVEEPDSLDPSVEAGFPSAFQPTALGSAYSECLNATVDHPPFEAWPSHADQALLAGDGPPVIPGARVVGSMAEHLGVVVDGSLDADARRLLQALVNWRYEGLMGGAARPWVFTFHAHLFDLYAGRPDPDIAEERDLRPMAGQSYRGDLEGMAALVDAFASRGAWQGVSAAGGGVLSWALPRDASAEGSRFSYGQEGAPPPEGLDHDSYPYLPLVAEHLARTHLVCAGVQDGVEIYGMLRCSGGWTWAGDAPGYHCADGAAPAWVYLLVPDGPRCLDAPSEAALAGAVDDEALGPAERCGEGIAVPIQGLILEPSEGPWWEEVCGAWGG